MPIIKSAAKKMRVDLRRSAHNLSIKSRMKTAIKKAEASKKFADVSLAYSVIDRAVKAGLIHKNLASREKATLSKLAKPVKLAEKKLKKTSKKTSKKPGKKTVKRSSARKSKKR